MTNDDFLRHVAENYARITEYAPGHDGSDGLCDCIGLIIGALRLGDYPWNETHGSNYAARYRMEDVRPIEAASELQPGDVVYKARRPSDPGYALPERYKNHPDQRDYYHVGVVVGVEPLTISHCTSVEGGKKQDHTLGQWAYVGRLDMLHDAPDEIRIVTAESGETVNMRSRPASKAAVVAQVPIGSRVGFIEEAAGWAHISYEGASGYMMSKFLRPDTPPFEEVLLARLDKIIALLEGGADHE